MLNFVGIKKTFHRILNFASRQQYKEILLMQPKQIKRFIGVGDSLTDPGVLDKRSIFFDLIPMRKLAGLERSPLGRFTNGMTWLEHLSAQIANQFLIQELKSELKKSDTDATEFSNILIDSQRIREKKPVNSRKNTKGLISTTKGFNLDRRRIVNKAPLSHEEVIIGASGNADIADGIVCNKHGKENAYVLGNHFATKYNRMDLSSGTNLKVSSMRINNILINSQKIREKRLTKEVVNSMKDSTRTAGIAKGFNAVRGKATNAIPLSHTQIIAAASMNADISDSIIYKQHGVKQIVENAYSLRNNLAVKYKEADFVRYYSEGGLSAHDYSWNFTTSISLFLKRIILSKLHVMREKLLSYDKEHKLSDAYKAETLIIEWSGANDLITVNIRATQREVDLAIKARVANVEQLIKNGYRHFVLFNLPDLSLTPRYQNMSQFERENAKKYSDYFNRELRKACEILSKIYTHTSVKVFDINKLFHEIYHNPEKYRIDPNKLKSSYIKSKEFKINPNKTSPAKGYMFWDDIHPTADIHAFLAEAFIRACKKYYHFTTPTIPQPKRYLNPAKEPLKISEADLKESFITKYQQTLRTDTLGFFGSKRRSGIDPYKATLEQILEHALYEKGHRTKRIITDLQWIDETGKMKLNIPVLMKARKALDTRRANSTQELQPILCQ